MLSEMYQGRVTTTTTTIPTTTTTTIGHVVAKLTEDDRDPCYNKDCTRFKRIALASL